MTSQRAFILKSEASTIDHYIHVQKIDVDSVRAPSRSSSTLQVSIENNILGDDEDEEKNLTPPSTERRLHPPSKNFYIWRKV